MKSYTKIAGFIAIIFLTAFIYGCSKPETNYDSFAKCLTEKGIVMYGTSWCPHCTAQKDMFGDSFKYVTFVDCDEEKDKCEAAGVKGYPTWKIDNVNYPGEKKLWEIAGLSKCTLEN